MATINNKKFVTFNGRKYRVNQEMQLAADLVQESAVTLDGANTFSGTNTYSGTNTFSGAAKVTGTLNYVRPVVTITDATYAVTAAQSGTIFSVDRAGGCAITLPTAAPGLEFDFYVKTTVSGTNTFSISSLTTGTLQGGITVLANDTLAVHNTTVNTLAFIAPAAADHQLVANATTEPKNAGTHFNFKCAIATKWTVSGVGIAAGTPTECFD